MQYLCVNIAQHIVGSTRLIAMPYYSCDSFSLTMCYQYSITITYFTHIDIISYVMIVFLDRCETNHTFTRYVIPNTYKINKTVGVSGVFSCQQPLTNHGWWLLILFFIYKSRTLDITFLLIQLNCDTNDQLLVGGFLRVLRFSPPIKLTATI